MVYTLDSDWLAALTVGPAVYVLINALVLARYSCYTDG